jgi:hypothetical protein
MRGSTDIELVEDLTKLGLRLGVEVRGAYSRRLNLSQLRLAWWVKFRPYAQRNLARHDDRHMPDRRRSKSHFVLLAATRHHGCCENGVRQIAAWANPGHSAVDGQSVGATHLDALHPSFFDQQPQSPLDARHGDVKQLGHRLAAGDDDSTATWLHALNERKDQFSRQPLASHKAT